MTEINTRDKDHIHFIEIIGEIDAGTSLLLDNAFKNGIDLGFKKMAVDLTKLQYISSAGLGVFISHIDEFDSNEIKLALFGINETVREVFEILGLEKLLIIKESEEKAIDYLNE